MAEEEEVEMLEEDESLQVEDEAVLKIAFLLNLYASWLTRRASYCLHAIELAIFVELKYQRELETVG